MSNSLHTPSSAVIFKAHRFGPIIFLICSFTSFLGWMNGKSLIIEYNVHLRADVTILCSWVPCLGTAVCCVLWWCGCDGDAAFHRHNFRPLEIFSPSLLQTQLTTAVVLAMLQYYNHKIWMTRYCPCWFRISVEKVSIDDYGLDRTVTIHFLSTYPYRHTVKSIWPVTSARHPSIYRAIFGYRKDIKFILLDLLWLRRQSNQSNYLYRTHS